MFYLLFKHVAPQIILFQSLQHAWEYARPVILCLLMTRVNEARRVQRPAWVKTENAIKSQTLHKAS